MSNFETSGLTNSIYWKFNSVLTCCCCTSVALPWQLLPLQQTPSGQCRSAHCRKEICAAPAVHHLLCAISSLKAFSMIFLCVLDQTAGPVLSAGSLAIALHQASFSEESLPFLHVFLPFYLHYYKSGRGTWNHKSEEGVGHDFQEQCCPRSEWTDIEVALSRATQSYLYTLSRSGPFRYDLFSMGGHILTAWNLVFISLLVVTSWFVTDSPMIFHQVRSAHT